MCITRAESDKQIFRWERSRLERCRSLGQEQAEEWIRSVAEGQRKRTSAEEQRKRSSAEEQMRVAEEQIYSTRALQRRG